MFIREVAIAPGERDPVLSADFDDPAFAGEADVAHAEARHRVTVTNRKFFESPPFYSACLLVGWARDYLLSHNR